MSEQAADEQAQAEALDDDKVDDVDYPPEAPMGVGRYGQTQAEEVVGEPVAERAMRERPEPGATPTRTDETAGQLVDEDEGARPDEEKDLVAEMVPQDRPDAPPAAPPSAEEDAVHVEPGG